MAARLIGIGDIHGCRKSLETLLDAVGPESDDTIVTLGDYVDRGPDSRGVIDLLIELREVTQLISILGNHEEMMMDVLHHGVSHQAWLRYGGLETLESYGFSGDLDFLPRSHVDFFASLDDYYESENHFFTHAAYDPELPLDQQEVEMLRWHALTEGIPGAHLSGRTAVVGHTANRDGEILDTGHLICLDTYCYGGGWLTAMDLNTRQTWQANERGELRQ